MHQREGLSRGAFRLVEEIDAPAERRTTGVKPGLVKDVQLPSLPTRRMGQEGHSNESKRLAQRDTVYGVVRERGGIFGTGAEHGVRRDFAPRVAPGLSCKRPRSDEAIPVGCGNDGTRAAIPGFRKSCLPREVARCKPWSPLLPPAAESA